MKLDSGRPVSAPIELRLASLATDRFEVIRKLGAGGMATVYEVHDRSTGRRLALKRLNPDSDEKRHRRVLELFEREFYTLSQISHPRVVEAYDYGIDDQGPYYTMELLDGGELQAMAPLPYADACRIACDLCSALSLLHSRRLVYRDLNPRNVHCTRDGSAKLIDFGATADMGPARQVVGTPAYCAPEALDLQPLDARADLYSLGATLYFALTARHAYPARTFAQLREVLAVRPPPPSEFVPDLPAALDALVMDLLHVDPAVRPANAAEVMEQLAAIAGQPIAEQLQVKQAYLSTPNLVGRDATLARTRAKFQRTLRGYGSALLFTGSSGVGRTRLLAACLLEAKLQGALALRADASDARGDYGVAHALGTALLEAAPELGARCAEPKLALIGHALPQLVASRSEHTLATFEDASQERAQVLASLREWFVAVARERPLLLAVDDFHAIDEPSAALLALCAHDTGHCPLAVAVTCESGAPVAAAGALKLFETAATSMQVVNLTPRHTEDLLRSVFGDVPQVQGVAHKLHAISQGNPRDTLQLAQYLVDKGLAQYRSGAWRLPAQFDAGDLPASMAAALRVQIDALDPETRNLANLVAMAIDRDLASDELIALYAEQPAKLVRDRLDELVARQLLERDGERYRVSHPGVSAALDQALSETERPKLHTLLAQLFGRRGNEGLRQALHLFAAGERALGLDTTLQYARDSQSRTANKPLEFLKLVESLPDAWFDVFTDAVEACHALGRPASEVFSLRYRLAALVNVMGVPSLRSHPQVLALLSKLADDCGLTDYAKLDPSLPPAERVKLAFEAARKRHESASTRERGLPPADALKILVRTQVPAAGMAAMALDYGFWTMLPPLAPYRALSPAVSVMATLIEGVGARISSRCERASELYLNVIEVTGREDRAGLDAANHGFVRYGVMCALGLMEAAMGKQSCLHWADQVETYPLHQVSAMQIRIAHEFWQGRPREADKLRERVELMRIESSPRQLMDGLQLVTQVVSHALSDDLTRLKHAIDELRGYAERYPRWSHVVQYAGAEYQRIRGDYAAAAQQLKAALDELECGTHPVWAFAAGAYVNTLCLLGDSAAACDLGTRYLQASEHGDLGYVAHYVRMPLAIAHAERGEFERAVELTQAVITGFQKLGSDGLNMVLAYETRARVAILAKDTAAYEAAAHACAEHCRAAGSRVLGAKYERLVRSAITAEVHIPESLPENLLTTLTGTQLTSVLVGCDRPAERAERALTLLLRRSGAASGYLYLIGDHGPELVAKEGPNEPPAGLSAVVSEFIDTELQDRELRTRSLEEENEDKPAPNSLWPAKNNEHHQLVLLSHQMPEGFAVTGAAALVITPSTQFTHPGSLASHLSRLMFDAGDVTPILS